MKSACEKRVVVDDALPEGGALQLLRPALPYSAQDIFSFAATDPDFNKVREYLKRLNKLVRKREDD